MTLGVPGCHDGTVSTAQPRSQRLHFARSKTDRIVSGVAGGIAERMGVDPLVVRGGFLMLSTAGGIGIALYLVALAFADDGPHVPGPPTVLKPVARSWSIVCFTGAALLLFRRVGLWIGDAAGWPLVLVVIGSLVVWLRRPSAGDEVRKFSTLVRTPPRTIRVVIGLVVSVIGVALLTFNTRSNSTFVSVLAAVGAVVLGIVMLVGPWARRAATELSDERRQRIRSEEKAAVSAHLHDSVLQTLTLIQRNAANPEMTARLAREQERELRTWLYQPDPGATGTARSEFEAMLRDVERAHDLTIEFVPVGDAPLDTAGKALVQATREALVNVAKHAGVSTASVFVEVSDDRLTAFVRDRGCGFAEATVADDHMGIRDSIRGRLERHGGTTDITSAPATGTEVEMSVPRRPVRSDTARPDAS
jgi:signal transduction histidine kinase/phage shock protein PspC (stress-responsive transcriptional regulator)